MLRCVENLVFARCANRLLDLFVRGTLNLDAGDRYINCGDRDHMTIWCGSSTRRIEYRTSVRKQFGRYKMDVNGVKLAMPAYNLISLI
jgi:hypothetical protein